MNKHPNYAASTDDTVGIGFVLGTALRYYSEKSCAYVLNCQLKAFKGIKDGATSRVLPFPLADYHPTE